MTKFLTLITATLVAACPQAGWARDVVVEVDAASGPWNVVMNHKIMPYGSGDEKSPTIVAFDIGGGKIGVYAEGQTDTADATNITANGIDDGAVDDRLAKKRRYPSFYTPKVLYPANRHALVAVFLNDKGMVLSRPIVVGNGVALPIPEGAAALALGFNDTTFAGNRGKLKVTVQFPE